MWALIISLFWILPATQSKPALPYRPYGPPPCGLRPSQFPWMKEKLWFDEIAWFCSNGTRVSATVVIPHTAWERREKSSARIQHTKWPYTPASWNGYTWYLQDGRQSVSGNSWWGHVILSSDTSPAWTYPNVGWRSPLVAGIFTNLTRTAQHISFHINTTAKPLLPHFGPCHLLDVMAWSAEKDPSWTIGICFMLPPTTTQKSTNMTMLVASSTSAVATNSMVINKKELTMDDWFQVTTGISAQINNWLLLAEQAANVTNTDCIVCMGPRPLLQVIPAAVPPDCVIPLMNSTVPSANCIYWDSIFPMSSPDKQKPLFSNKAAAANYTCVNFTKGTDRAGMDTGPFKCHTTLTYSGTPGTILSRSDIWWWCGGTSLYDRLPRNMTAVCALVTLLLPVNVYPTSASDLLDRLLEVRTERVTKRAVLPGLDPTYIDAIGVPRGVPDEYKLADQVAAGWESAICWWCTINKNVDRINYVHYNVQRLSNWTQAGFEAVHEQLAATSLMAFQNRVALDMLLAEKGGVCAMFGTQCCAFIPNNTAADGGLTRAVEGLRSLNNKMKEHSGVDTSMWDSWLNMFGAYKTLISSILISLAVFAAILTTCGCCLIPCLRSLIQRLIVKTIEDPNSPASIYLLRAHSNDSEIDESDDEYVA